jgi:serine phosphatase RsbU (regulator of sigma subunit)
VSDGRSCLQSGCGLLWVNRETMDSHDTVERLRGVPLFAGLDPLHLRKLARRMRAQVFEGGQTIFQRGDPGDSLFVICHGRVRIELPSDDGPPLPLRKLAQGEFFGEMALLDGQARSASAVAIEPTQTLVLHLGDFHEFLRISPQAAIQILSLLSERLRQSTERLQELVIGRSLQARLLAPPRLCLDGFEILSRLEPAVEVGGDFYNLFELADPEEGAPDPCSEGETAHSPSPGAPARLGVVLGDVAGKGVPAALLMAVVTTVIEAQAQLLRSPAATLAAANALLYPKMHGPEGGQPLFATALYGVLDMARRELHLANAGQTPPIVCPAAGMPRYLRLTGVPLGAFRSASYEGAVLPLEAGDRVLFCSDGFIEEYLPDGTALGYDGFLRRLVELRERSGPELIEALFEANEPGPPALDDPFAGDDRTLVLITATP